MVSNYYTPKLGENSKNIFYPYYATEAGLMIGNFYYNTDFLSKKGYVTNILMYAPSSNIGVEWLTLKNIPVFYGLKAGGEIFYATFEEVRLYYPGNDSVDKPGGNNEAKGYDSGKGGYFNIRGDLKKDIDEKKYIKIQIVYNTMMMASKLQAEDINLKTDKIGLEYGIDTTDKSGTPFEGEKILFLAEKSLNMISKDKNNDWDYYKLTADFRKYIKTGNKNTVALRFLTVYMDYLKNIGNNMNNPDMATLGDLDVFRGYYYMRFKDKNSAVFQGEYRFPITDDGVVRGTVFAEAGRVGEKYNLDLFSKELKYDVGAGIHYYFNKDVMIRGDIAFSEEKVQLRMATTQAF